VHNCALTSAFRMPVLAEPPPPPHNTNPSFEHAHASNGKPTLRFAPHKFTGIGLVLPVGDTAGDASVEEDVGVEGVEELDEELEDISGFQRRENSPPRRTARHNNKTLYETYYYANCSQCTTGHPFVQCLPGGIRLFDVRDDFEISDLRSRACTVCRQESFKPRASISTQYVAPAIEVIFSTQRNSSVASR
jgi:hypothetical protein